VGTQRPMSTTVTNVSEQVTKPFQDIPAPKGIYKWPYVGLALHFEPFGE